MPPKQKYTDPKLREEVKEEIKQSDKGGEPGQWSARKAQMMASEYKKRGGDYNTPKSKKDESAKNLDNWTDEDWQTKEGEGGAKKADGSRKRYLPKKAWEEMDEGEKEKTDDKKQAASKKGQQYVANTSRAKSARKNAQEEDAEDANEDEEEQEEEQEEEAEEKPATRKRGRPKKEDQEEEKQEEKKTPGKRGRPRKQEDESKKEEPASKKSKSSGGSGKTVGSRHDKAEPPAQQATLKRLPKKGTQAYWKAMPGWVDGKVVEILKSDKQVDGKNVKASKEEPKIVLESNKSGKTCIHKVDNVYFD